jgi:hypothetical protein
VTRARLLRMLAAVAATAVAVLAPAGVASAVPPTVSTLAPANVTSQSATLRGRVNPRALATTYFFQYGPTAAYGQQTPPAAAGSGTAAVNAAAAIAGLAPSTTYHFRLVATNASGTAVTPDRSFRTAAQALAVSMSATPNPIAFGGPTTLVGTLSGTGRAGRTVQLQQNPFPFTAGFADVANAVVSDAQGRFSIALLSVALTTQFRARVTDRAGVVSPVVTVGVRAIVRSRVSRTRLRRGGRVHFSGSIRPAEPGRPLAIQKRRGGRWITVSGTVARAGGAGFAVYGKTIRVRRGGLFRVFLGTGSGVTLPTVGRTFRLRTSR